MVLNQSELGTKSSAASLLLPLGINWERTDFLLLMGSVEASGVAGFL
jgi:hypothetical protein